MFCKNVIKMIYKETMQFITKFYSYISDHLTFGQIVNYTSNTFIVKNVVTHMYSTLSVKCLYVCRPNI